MVGFRYVFFLLIAFNHDVYAEDINFLVHPINPFIIQTGSQFSGIAIEIMNELIEKNSTEQSYILMPFPRALKTIKENDDYGLFIVARTKEREDTVKWVGPLISSCVFLYKHKDNPVEVKSLADIKGKYSISVGRGNADHEYLTEQNFTMIQPVTYQFQSLLMLNKKRVDFTPMSELVMPEMIKMANISADNIENTYIKLYDSELYLAFSKNVGDDVINQWQQRLDEFKQTPKYFNVIDKYLHQ